MAFHLPPSIMVIDSDVVTRTSCSNFLERAGFIVITASSGDDALQKLKKLSSLEKPNLIVVDNVLSDFSGIELCTLLRTKKIEAHIILVAQKEDKLEGLKGATNACDDYMIKPFHQIDLTYKIKVLLSRIKPNLQSKIIEFRDIRMNLASYKVTRTGRSVHLGPTEFRLLQCFVENPTKIFSRNDLIEYLWGDRDVESRTIDVHINRLRTALKLPDEHVHVIKTIRAAGYCLLLPEKVTINA
jgi:two-component system phosphate regulon response regulator PhoB